MVVLCVWNVPSSAAAMQAGNAIAPCKVIRIRESKTFLPVESGILGFGIWNPAKSRNPESRQGLQSGIQVAENWLKMGLIGLPVNGKQLSRVFFLPVLRLCTRRFSLGLIRCILRGLSRVNLRTLRGDQISSQQSATEWNVKKTRCENLVGSMQVVQDGKMFAQRQRAYWNPSICP